MQTRDPEASPACSHTVPVCTVCTHMCEECKPSHLTIELTRLNLIVKMNLAFFLGPDEICLSQSFISAKEHNYINTFACFTIRILIHAIMFS